MYFTDEAVEFFSSGATLLDCALGGGWARGRVENIVGDKSSGKTLLALEAIANNTICSPKSLNKYADVEEAFDIEYIRSLGVPVDKISFEHEVYTVEEFYARLETMEGEVEEKSNGLYVLDSLDALSDAAELEREIGDATYGGNKARKMSELFRRINAKISHKGITLFVISQVRDMLNSKIAGQKTRAGGKALDFYASHTVWLTETGKIKRTIDKIERIVGLEIQARIKKNKVGMPWRQCDLQLIFGYGIDDIWSNLNWLQEVNALKRVDLIKDMKLDTKTAVSNLAKDSLSGPKEQRQELGAALSKVVTEYWDEIEEKFATKQTKY